MREEGRRKTHKINTRGEEHGKEKIREEIKIQERKRKTK